MGAPVSDLCSGCLASSSKQLISCCRRPSRPAETPPTWHPLWSYLESLSALPYSSRQPSLTTVHCGGVVFPAKVLQLHLSKEEQAQLSRSVALSLPIRKRAARRSSTRPSRPHSKTIQSRVSQSTTQQPTFFLPATPPPIDVTDAPAASAAMPLPEQNYLDAMERWRAQEARLDEYNQKVANTEKHVERRRRSRSRRPSFRRAFSTAPDGSDMLPLSTVSGQATPSQTPGRKSFSLKRASAPAPPPDARGPSHYYQDPEARRKLKLCLATPQKFQEAIEYGFPASPRETAMPNFSRPRAYTGPSKSARASNDAQRFLKENTLSFLDDTSSEAGSSDEEGEDHENEENDDDYEDDDASLTELDSPVTPADGEALRRAANFLPVGPGNSPYASLGSMARQRNFAAQDECVPEFADVPWPPMREMTMRMTLTRPELRAREEEIYGYQAGDALAVPEISPAQRAAGLGHRRGESGKVRTLLSKMKPGRQRR